MNTKYLLLPVAMFTAMANADNSTLDAAIGGGLGGATGAAIGNEVGGRDGAIVGGALGAAVGTAITTDSDEHHHEAQYVEQPRRQEYYEPAPATVYPRSTFCPPGQAKKGRC